MYKVEIKYYLTNLKDTKYTPIRLFYLQFINSTLIVLPSFKNNYNFQIHRRYHSFRFITKGTEIYKYTISSVGSEKIK